MMRDIEARRKQLALSVETLCATAGLASRHYYRLLKRTDPPEAATAAKLNRALHRFQVGVGEEAAEMAPHAAFKLCQVLAALALQADARNALAQKPGRRATFDPAWMQAARVRWVAMFILNQCLGFSISDVARAADLTKAAVSDAMKKLEDRRDDDAALNQVLDQMEEIFR